MVQYLSYISPAGPTEDAPREHPWTVRAVGDVSQVPQPVRERNIAATVPGCVHTDLVDAGLLADPSAGLNERDAQWVSWTDWRYEREFEGDPALLGHDDAVIVFECLDTIATVELNGIKIGAASNEFVPHRFDAAGALKRGTNRLSVTISSPLRHIRDEAARLGTRPINGDWDPYVFIRKCASNFRWDWGPRVATSGITGAVRLECSVPRCPDRIARAPAVLFDPVACAFTRDGSVIEVRGANWIPEGLWPRDRTPARIRERLRQLLDAGMNMIRVWGGGRYEPDWFYELCDEMKILVWHDFMFACACYPEEEPIRSLVEAEAAYQIGRLSEHPCVVLWCGGNECVWAHESWGFKEKLGAGVSWGAAYYFEMLPKLCAAIDPARAYWPNSPWSGAATLHPNDATHGDRHTWDVWGDGYRSVVPRLCSEFGQQSPSNYATLDQAGLVNDPARSSRAGEHADDAASVESRGGVSERIVPRALRARQLGPGGMARWYDEPLAELFGTPRDFDEWHYLAQLLQARCMTIGIEWMRANWPTCSGSLVWQLNDAWPGFSWSLIDSAGRKKPAWYAARRANQSRRLSIQPLESGLALVAINSTDEEWDDRAEVRRMTYAGSVRARGQVRFKAASRSVCRVADVADAVGVCERNESEFIVADAQVAADVDATRAWWFFAKDKQVDWPVPRIHTDMASAHGVTALTITAQTFIRDLTIAVDRVDPSAEVSDQLLTLLAGERRTIVIAHSSPLDRAVLTARPVLMCANSIRA